MKQIGRMTPRERACNAMDFKQVDAIPWSESFYPETVVEFLSEGLPVHEVVVLEWEMYSNLLNNSVKLTGFDLNSYFGIIPVDIGMVPVDIGPIPRFKQRKIGENDRYEEYILQTGARCRRIKKSIREGRYAMPSFYDFPVKDKKSWEQYKERLNPNDSRRYPRDWEADSYLQALEEYQKGPTTLTITGFYGFGAQLMGIQDFNLSFYRDPELIREMISHWEYFTIESIRESVETFKDRIDLVFWWEDLAERHGPIISPRLYKEFLLSHYKRVTDLFKKNKIRRILMDSDGNTQPILDLAIEAGMTGHYPLEVNAGMDVRSLRKRYGNKLFLVGNLDKRQIAKGGEAMRKEIDSKLPFMKETGGYIAGLDHGVSVEFTLQKFREYADYLGKNLPY